VILIAPSSPVVGVPEREQPVAPRVVLRGLDRRLDRVAAGGTAEDEAAVAGEASGNDLVELVDEIEARFRREVDGVGGLSICAWTPLLT